MKTFKIFQEVSKFDTETQSEQKTMKKQWC